MTWKDWQWQQVCGVTLREVRTATRLLMVEGSHLFPMEKPLETAAAIETMLKTLAD